MAKIIGLLGKKGSGKSTVANFLVTSYKYTEIDHATPLRQAFLAVVGQENAKYMHDRALKESPIPKFGFSYRQFAEGLGSGGLLGQLNQDWARFAAEACVEVLLRAGSSIVFSNLRAPAEIEHVQTLPGAELWYIDRKKNPHDDGSKALTEADYRSYADVVIPNNRTVPELLNYIRSRL